MTDCVVVVKVIGMDEELNEVAAPIALLPPAVYICIFIFEVSRGNCIFQRTVVRIALTVAFSGKEKPKLPK